MKKQRTTILAVITMLLTANVIAFAQAIGESSQDPVRIPTGGGTYIWHLPNGTYNDVWYNVTAYFGHLINATLLVPVDADFDLELYGPYFKANSKNGTGINENIAYTADWGGNWSIRVIRSSGQGDYTLIVDPTNHPPEIPSAPSGNTSGFVYTSYTYTTSTIDLDQDIISFQFDWNDSTTTSTGWYVSGATGNASHQWEYPRTHQLKVRARDLHGNWSDWSAFTSVTLSQNDAEKPGDAGNEILSARDLPTDSYIGQPYSLKGTLYYTNPTDTDDYYNFTVVAGDHIYITMTPPSNADFDLYLYRPSGFQAANSTTPTAGQTETIDYNADMGGNWTLRVNRATAEEGQYSFTVQVGWKLTLKKSGCPLIINIWVDDQAFCSFPVTLWIHAGSHTLQAQAQASQGTWPYWIYYFDHWSDGVTDNPRTLNITQDTTMTAYYVRGGGPP